MNDPKKTALIQALARSLGEGAIPQDAKHVVGDVLAALERCGFSVCPTPPEGTDDLQKFCACGWKKPIVALTLSSGVGAVPVSVVPAVACASCGDLYVAAEVDAAAAARILATLRGELAAAADAATCARLGIPRLPR